MPPLGVSQSLLDRTIAPVLSETGHILARTEEVDEGGGISVTYVKGPAIKCGLAPLKGGEYTGIRAQTRPTGSRIDDRTTHVITVPAGTAVDETCQIEIEGHGKFEVTALRRRSLEIAREIEAREAS